MRAVLPEQMREMDRRTIEDVGIPSIVLMERASLGGVEAILARTPREQLERVGVLCGGGNNGGDGFAMARLLAERGVDVRIWRMSPPERLSRDARVNHDVALRLGLPVDDAPEGDAGWQALRTSGCTLWLDALLGTGLDRTMSGRYAEAVRFLNAQPHVIAVDTPTGLNAATGQVWGDCARAQLTVSFGAPKLGQLVEPGRSMCGELVVVPIGIPPAVMREVGDAATWLNAAWATGRLKPRPADAHKGSVGKALIVAGSAGMAGAAALCATACLTAGAGLITAACAPEAMAVITATSPEVMTAGVLGASGLDLAGLRALSSRADVVAIGPGLGTDPAAEQALGVLLRGLPEGVPMVLDADALNLLAREQHLRAALRERAAAHPVVLTPHPGEAARLLRDATIASVQEDPIAAARAITTRFGAITALKQPATILSAPDGRLAVNATGNPGMATAGMGDVLTGVLAACLAERPDDPFEAACVAVHAHGLAGDRVAARQGTRGTTASAVAREIGLALASMERS